MISYILDTSVCTGSCSSLDHILTYLFKNLSKQKLALSPSATLLQLPQVRPEILQVSSYIGNSLLMYCYEGDVAVYS